MQRRMRVFIVFAIIAGLVALSWAYVGGAPRSGAASYRFATVERADLAVFTLATGRIEAIDVVEVSSQLSGQVAELLADFNDEVKAGAPLARLDDKTYEAAVAEAEARLAQAMDTVVGEITLPRTSPDQPLVSPLCPSYPYLCCPAPAPHDWSFNDQFFRGSGCEDPP